jgi:TolB protein
VFTSLLWWWLGWLRRLLRWGRPEEIAYFAYSVSGADGETTSQEDVFAVDPGTGQVRRLTDDRTNPVFVSDRNPAWSPDRRTLAIHRGSDVDPVSRLYLLSAADGSVRRTLVPGVGPQWLGTGTLLYLDDQRDVWTVDVRTLATRRITDLGADVTVDGMSWHPVAGLAIGYAGPGDRSSIATVPAASVVAAAAPGGSVVGPDALTFRTAPGVNASFPDWSPTADRIALTTWEPGSPGRVGHLMLSSGAITLVPGAPPLSDHGAVFSPDGREIAWVRGQEDTWTEIWLADLTTGDARRLTDDAQTRFKAGLDW